MKFIKEKKGQMTAIIGVIVFFIMIIWLAWSGWILNNNIKKEYSGLQKVISDFKNDVNDIDLNSTKKSLSDIVNEFKSFINEDNKIEESITDSIKEKLIQNKLDNWIDYSDQIINFKYPNDWSMSDSENGHIWKVEDQVVAQITIYQDKNFLPNNINSLVLEDWLAEQVNRDLGDFTSYKATDLNNNYDIYLVNLRDSEEESFYWQVEDIIYQLDFLNKDLVGLNKELIISNIK